MSVSQISALFVIWSAASTLLEVPTGALADLVSRQRLLLLASLVYGSTFLVWVAFPSFSGFAVGFVLWGLSGAVVSGTFQAYVYDTLTAHGATHAYPGVVARSQAAGLTLNLLATLLAAPLLSWGGYSLVAGVSIAACLAQAVIALTLPPDTRPEQDHDEAERGYLGLLRAGVHEAARSTPVRHAVLIAAVLSAFLVFDEYFSLLARDLGAATTTVPVLIAITVAAQAVGALLGARLRQTALVRSLGASAVFLVAGSLWGHPVGMIAIAGGYGLLQMTIVAAETRLQAVITGPARATVTSVAGLLTELFAILIYVGFAVGGGWLPLTALSFLLAVALLLVAGLSRRWLPTVSRRQLG